MNTIVEEDLQYLQVFPRAYELHGFVTQLDQDDGVEDGSECGLDDAPKDGLNVLFIKMRHFSNFETCSHILQV